jgi:hypothetical protein
LWVAAWQAGTMACCTDGMCPAHGHTNHQSQDNAPPQPTPCDHQTGLSLIQCSMSCCHTEVRSFVTAIVFVLPASPAVSRLALVLNPPPANSSREILPPIAPPDLPPRGLLS